MNVRLLILIIAIASQLASCSKDSLEPELPHSTQDAQVAALAANNTFTTMLSELTTDSKTIDFEAGYFLYPSQSQTFYYERVEGQRGEPSILLQPKGQIAGVVHCHFTSLFPLFSGTDVKALFELYSEEHVYDHQVFFCGVVSYTGRGYLLLIEDMKKFLGFSESNLVNRELFGNFERYYFSKQQGYYLTDPDFEGSYEKALADILSGSGIVLYKSRGAFRKWSKLVFENGVLREQIIQ